MQYFVGLHEFHPESLFDPSMMVHFRKRFPVEEVAKINEYVCTGKWPEEQRNVDRNDGTDDRNEPSVPPSSEGESAAHHGERLKGKQTPWSNSNEGCGLKAAVEGRNGSARCRFGLGRLISKLAETAKTDAALILLAINACHRLARWLVLFFQNLCFSFVWPTFSAELILYHKP